MIHHRLAWLLLILFQLQLAPMRELIKLPMLWLHFQEDSENGSFMDFIYTHYHQEQVPDLDWQKDLNLPFKDVNQNHLWDIAILDDLPLMLLFVELVEYNSIWDRQDWIKMSAFIDIFHPPNRSALF